MSSTALIIVGVAFVAFIIVIIILANRDARRLGINKK